MPNTSDAEGVKKSKLPEGSIDAIDALHEGLGTAKALVTLALDNFDKPSASFRCDDEDLCGALDALAFALRRVRNASDALWVSIGGTI